MMLAGKSNCRLFISHNDQATMQISSPEGSNTTDLQTWTIIA